MRELPYLSLSWLRLLRAAGTVVAVERSVRVSVVAEHSKSPLAPQRHVRLLRMRRGSDVSRLAARSKKLAPLLVCLALLPVDSLWLSFGGSQAACDEHGAGCRCVLACSRAEHQHAPRPEVGPSCHRKSGAQDSHLSEEASAPSKNTAAWTTCTRPNIDATALDETVYLTPALSIQSFLMIHDSVGPAPYIGAALIATGPHPPPPRA